MRLGIGWGPRLGHSLYLLPMPLALAKRSSDPGSARVMPRSLSVTVGQGGDRRIYTEADGLKGGQRRFCEGTIGLTLSRLDHGSGVTVEIDVTNCGERPLFLESVSVGLVWCGHGACSHRFLRHGWQSWSYTGYRDLDETGEPPFPSGAWLRGMHHCVGEPAREWTGWHESATLALMGSAEAHDSCVAGVLETGRNFGIVHLRSHAVSPDDLERPVDLDVEIRVETILVPGESRKLDAVRVAVGHDANELLERFTTLWGRCAGARVDAASRLGWCSWYHYFHRVTQDDLFRNLDALAASKESIPVSVVQLDDGYQRTIGDWLETNDKFPIGLEGIAKAIREAGFEPGLWTAPFAASAESWVLRTHPEWALKDRSESDDSVWLRGSYNPEWSQSGWVYALDTADPELLLHLEAVFSELVELGFVYQKLDFLYMAAMEGRSSDPSQTRAARLRAGLAAIRRGAGEQAFLLGCGSPLGPAVGWVDSMRIGPDVAPSWEVDQPLVIPGMEPALPSTRGALRSTAARLFTHRRLWINDPDCLLARSRETSLSREEVGSLAALIGVSGGLGVFSDDVAELGETERQLIAAVDQQRQRVDQPEWGSVRILDPLNTERNVVLEAWMGPSLDRAQINLGEEPVSFDQGGDLRESSSIGLPEFTETDGQVESEVLAPHASHVQRFASARGLTIFCDFDGTFSIRDVGSSIAQRWLHEKRAALGKRYQSGVIDAWTYAVMLFNGFSFGVEELETFLKTIDLDPGAEALLEWCASRSVPFKILSDGFDFNLEVLQRIHDVHFDFVANQLRIEKGIWSIQPGGRNPDCDCGTGVCKRAIVEARRKEAPRECIVHIGNGRVSDRCGAEAADVAFAKETLAEELATRGVAFRPFETLLDVVESLNAGWAV